MDKLTKLKQSFGQAAQKVTRMEAKRELLKEQKATAANHFKAMEKEILLCGQVQLLLEKTSEFARNQAKKRIEEITSQALNVVFGTPHKFSIVLKTKNNQPYAEYWLDDGVKTRLERPDFSRGGGKVDIITLALRLAAAELLDIKGPLVLDEVGKHVSAEYAANVAYFLKEYARQFKRQIVLITHNTTLAEIGDVSLQVVKKNGESVVTQEC